MVGSSDDWPLRNLSRASAAANMPIIIVSMNYRLGGLGFAALPELSASAGSGNLGLLDQRLALEWVQRNIGRFGGNRDRVTIWGQSAGGQSVCFHLASPSSAGLFARAISSSGPCILPYPGLADAEAQGVTWASRVGCNSPTGRLACLKNVSVAQLLNAGMPRASPHNGFLYPVIDATSTGFPADNRELFRTGRFNRVPVMIGSTDDDLGYASAHGFAPFDLAGAQLPRYLQALANAVGLGPDFVAELASNYPLSRREAPTSRDPAVSPAFATLLDLIGDSNIACTAFDTAMFIAGAMASPPPVFKYSFVYRAPQDGREALHASDLPFLFGDPAEFDNSTPAGFSAVEAHLAGTMQRRLLRFTMAGEPGAGWPELGPWMNGTRVMVFSAQPNLINGWKAARCSMWRRQREATRWLGDSELTRIFKNVSEAVARLETR